MAAAEGYSGDDLIAAVHRLNRIAMYGGIRAKREAVTVLQGVTTGLANAARVLAGELRQAGYSDAITGPVYAGSDLVENGGNQFGDAKTALERLLNTRVGDLPSSGQGVPDRAELNRGH